LPVPVLRATQASPRGDAGRSGNIRAGPPGYCRGVRLAACRAGRQRRSAPHTHLVLRLAYKQCFPNDQPLDCPANRRKMHHAHSHFCCLTKISKHFC
jgi:hypothetical protein